jgi:hypothetical protein
MAQWIKTSGEVIEVHPKNDGKVFTIEELKGFVDGFIECVFLNDKQVLVVNEEGKLKGMPYNPVATEVYCMAFQPNRDIIVGDALLCKLGEEIN